MFETHSSNVRLLKKIIDASHNLYSYPVGIKTGSIRDYSYWTSRKNSLELIELSSINKVSLV